ncbi:MAG: transcription antitermination factor NusB [Deltaproteobacteria bacterium]|nr:transcription antitermination factor NusB [Deltaproteobacteria bacterium]
MRPVGIDQAREAAAYALSRVLDDGAWAGPALSGALDGHTSLSERDKALVTELFYGALRFAGPLERSLLRGADKPTRGLDKRIRPHLLIAAYQLQHLQKRIPAHAAVDAAVSAIKRVRPGLDGFANALLRHLGSPLHELLKPGSTLVEIAEAWGVPMSLASAIAKDLPDDERAAAVAGLCDRPSSWAASFTSETVKTLESLATAVALGQPLARHAFVPGLLEVPGGRASHLPGFSEGQFIVVDPSAVLAVEAMGARAGQRVLDLCAASGSKSMLLARAGAHVTAVEQNAKRAKKITELARRLRMEVQVDVVVGDAADAALTSQQFDAVLLDAPCSGLGTTRRKPEVKLRSTDADVAAHVLLQARLFDAAASRVKPGGVLVYAVSSPLAVEGREQVKRFLVAHPDFERDALGPLLPWVPASALDVDGQLRLRPHQHDADAVFISRLRRNCPPDGPPGA